MKNEEKEQKMTFLGEQKGDKKSAIDKSDDRFEDKVYGIGVKKLKLNPENEQKKKSVENMNSLFQMLNSNECQPFIETGLSPGNINCSFLYDLSKLASSR